MISRLEINVSRLLSSCERLASENAIADWRLKNYVETLETMITELRNGPNKPSKDTLADYTRRHTFLKGLLQTAKLNDPIEKVAAVQHLSHGAATACGDSITKQIHQKATTKYENELRADLFGDDSDDMLRKRNIKKPPSAANSNVTEDVDTLIKYHHDMQEKVAENMLLLTKSLKEQSQLASTIIRRDTGILKTSTDLTDQNFESLKVESARLDEHNKRAWKCWLWLMIAAVVVIFLYMVLFMKLFKKKSYPVVTV